MAAMLPFAKSCVKYQTASCVRVHSEPIPFHIQVNINAQDQDRSGFDHLLAVGWTYVSCDRSISAVWRNGPLRNDRPLDNQSRPPATDTGQELWKLIGARLSIMQEVAKYKWNNNAPIEDPDPPKIFEWRLQRTSQNSFMYRSSQWHRCVFRGQDMLSM
jgi:hypothetical protein